MNEVSTTTILAARDACSSGEPFFFAAFSLIFSNNYERIIALGYRYDKKKNYAISQLLLKKRRQAMWYSVHFALQKFVSSNRLLKRLFALQRKVQVSSQQLMKARTAQAPPSRQ